MAKSKTLEELINSLPEVYYYDDLPYWLTLNKILKVWDIKYLGDRIGNNQEVIFWSRSRDIRKAIRLTLKKIKEYNKISNHDQLRRKNE